MIKNYIILDNTKFSNHWQILVQSLVKDIEHLDKDIILSILQEYPLVMLTIYLNKYSKDMILNERKLMELMSKNLNLDWSSPFHVFLEDMYMSPLTYVCSWVNVRQVKLLLKFGADPNRLDDKGNSPLETVLMFYNHPYILHSNRIKCAKLLIEFGAILVVRSHFFSDYMKKHNDKDPYFTDLFRNLKFIDREKWYD